MMRIIIAHEQEVFRASILILIFAAFSIAFVVLMLFDRSLIRPFTITPWPFTASTVTHQFTLMISSSLTTNPFFSTQPARSADYIQFISGGWLGLAGVSVVKRREKSRWALLGFDEDVFALFEDAKGGPTRVKLLEDLKMARDRSELAKEAGLQWKTIDYQITILMKHGLIRQLAVHGDSIRVYMLTDRGENLLNLIHEESRGVSGGRSS
ncbi:MAG: hypothetical protein JRM78_02700 [Nitrososphaerota archaeon]|jgi:predicted transcriptional regulator|nr:hypothetical protein [Nitrososphaerota archaeon]